jgi:hypothetical protein
MGTKPYKKPYQKPLPKEDEEEDEGKDNDTRSSIVPTDSWLNRHGNAVYVNIPKSDVRYTTDKDGNQRISFITSVSSLDDLVKGYRMKEGNVKKPISGVNLGRFED